MNYEWASGINVDKNSFQLFFIELDDIPIMLERLEAWSTEIFVKFYDLFANLVLTFFKKENYFLGPISPLAFD